MFGDMSVGRECCVHYVRCWTRKFNMKIYESLSSMKLTFESQRFERKNCESGRREYRDACRGSGDWSGERGSDRSGYIVQRWRAAYIGPLERRLTKAIDTENGTTGEEYAELTTAPTNVKVQG
jgi:hypothetical protein